MWFIGLVAGMILGGFTGSGGGVLAGGILGLAGGLIYGELSRSRTRPLEERVEALENKVKQLFAQIAAVNPGQPPAAQPETESRTVSTAQMQPAFIAPPATLSVAPEIPDATEPSETLEFSRAIKPVFTQTSDREQLEKIPPEKFKQNQRYQETEPAGSILAEHQWLANLFKGNVLAKIGVIILFFGIASGLKLAVDMGLFPISVRLMLGAFAAIALSVFGYHRAQRPEHRMFGLAMQGGGLGVLYLLVYFMLARYQIVSETLAFILFTLIGVSCVLLAARQDGRSLAMLGISGAFLSPVMVANSGGSQITLFSYFLLLNTFIISVNWFKGWRELNMSGFIFTLVIGMNWAFRSYVPSDFPVSETFLILFFLLYSATPVLFNLFNAPGRLSWGDGMLLYGTPLAAAALQNHLLQGQDMTLAWNACAAGAYYLLLWWAIHRRPTEETVWLEKSLLGIAIGFFTIAIPLAFNAQLTSAFWTLEGFGVLYLGVKQNRFLARLSGSALQVVAGIYFYAHSHELQRAFPIFNDFYVGSLIVVVASFASALLLRHDDNLPTGTEKKITEALPISTADLALPFLYWGLLWWFAAGFSEIFRFSLPAYQSATWLGLCLLSFLFLEWFGVRRNWRAMRQPTLLLLPAIFLAAYNSYLKHDHILTGSMFMLIPLSLFAQYWLLYRHDRDSVPSACQLRHATGYWFLVLLASNELGWVSAQISPAHALWLWLAWGIAGAFGILASLHGLKQEKWPFSTHRSLYLDTMQLPVVLALSIWVIYGNLSQSGGGSGLPYLPLLNAFDLVQLLAMYAIWKWLRITASTLLPALYAIAFLWVSTEAARLTHHWGGVPFEWHSLLASSMLQAGLSMLWTAIAMGVMIYASQKKLRSLWFNGFGLLAIVGIKLMMVDLSNKGTAVWTVSLIGIALLIIATSYFSPAPPKNEITQQPR